MASRTKTWAFTKPPIKVHFMSRTLRGECACETGLLCRAVCGVWVCVLCAVCVDAVCAVCDDSGCEGVFVQLGVFVIDVLAICVHVVCVVCVCVLCVCVECTVSMCVHYKYIYVCVHVYSASRFDCQANKASAEVQNETSGLISTCVLRTLLFACI